MIGTIIKDQYRILELLGEGGMGIVYKAMDLELERLVALKVLKAELGNNSVLIQRFRDELRTLAGFNHPNIATLFTSITWEGSPVMVMEFVEGQTLSDMVANRGPIPSQVCLPLIKQALAGVSLAHRRKIIHRDIKPANLMLNTDGVVKVMDFGIAKIQNAPGLTRSNAGIGTSYYMAPEQIRGAVDVRSDIYAMGVTLYELLAGQVPFQGASQYDIEHAHISEIPRPPTVFYPHIPDLVVAAVMRSLEKDPEARFQTADEFSAALSDGIASIVPPSPDLRAVEVWPSQSTITSASPAAAATVPSPASNRVLRATSPGVEPTVDQGSKAVGDEVSYQLPAVSSSANTATHTVPSSEKRSKLVFAGLAAMLLLVTGGGFWAFSLANQPAPAVVDQRSVGNAGGGSDGGSASKTVPGPTPSNGGHAANGPGTEPIFTLPKASPASIADNAPIHPPVIHTNDGLSGRWTGQYQNLCSDAGSTRVKMILARKTDESITGDMNFVGQDGIGGKCSLSGKFHPQDGSLTLAAGGCNGTVPSYFQSKHQSALMFAGSKMSGSVSPEDSSTCVQVSLSKAN